MLRRCMCFQHGKNKRRSLSLDESSSTGTSTNLALEEHRHPLQEHEKQQQHTTETVGYLRSGLKVLMKPRKWYRQNFSRRNEGASKVQVCKYRYI